MRCIFCQGEMGSAPVACPRCKRRYSPYVTQHMAQAWAELQGGAEDRARLALEEALKHTPASDRPHLQRYYTYLVQQATAMRATKTATETGSQPVGMPNTANDATGRQRTSLGDILGMAFLTFLFVIAIVNGVKRCRAEHRMDPIDIPELQEHVAEYVNIPGLQMEPSPGDLKGKVVVVDVVKKALHPLQRELSASQAAQKPEDVGIVIWIAPERVYEFDLVPQAGPPEGSLPYYASTTTPYTGTIRVAVYRALWHVTVIDWATKQVRYQNSFRAETVPAAGVNFRSLIGSSQLFVYTGDTKVEGAEILYGTEGGAVLTSGEHIIGIVSAPPWDETLRWLREILEKTQEYHAGEE